jgi:hypothetical protein
MTLGKSFVFWNRAISFWRALSLRTPETFLFSNLSIQKIFNFLIILVLYNGFDFIEFIENNLLHSQVAHFQIFIKSTQKLRDDFNNLNILLRVVNSLIHSLCYPLSFA